MVAIILLAATLLIIFFLASKNRVQKREDFGGNGNNRIDAKFKGRGKEKVGVVHDFNPGESTKVGKVKIKRSDIGPWISQIAGFYGTEEYYEDNGRHKNGEIALIEGEVLLFK
jgi:hypothetical protein